MLLATVLAGLFLALAAEEVITKPAPGNEYVSFSSGLRHGRRSTDGDMKVYVKDEGATGYHHKPFPGKKSGLTPGKKEQTSLKAAVKDEGATGAHLKESSGIGVPPLKHISFANSDTKSHKKNEKQEESPDFEDSPLVPAASSQSSRINVKKGPNGQEYEYEYVYYYYDDDEEEGKGGAKTDKPVVNKTERPDIEDNTEPQPRHRLEAKNYDKQEVRDQDKEEDIRQITRQELRDEIHQGDFKSGGKQELRHAEGRRGEDLRDDSRQDLRSESRQGFRQEGKQDFRPETRDSIRHDSRDSFRQDGKQDYKEDSRQDLRYEGRQRSEGRQEGRHRERQDSKLDETKVGFEQRVDDEPVRRRGGERRHEGRGHSRLQPEERPEEERRRRPVQPVEDNASAPRTRYTTIERGRGKGSDYAVTTVEPSSNEVLPTRSPSRGRQSEGVEEDRLPANARFPGRSRSSTTAEPPATRSRGSAAGGGSVRRPSLVDSSSFRTHSSDAAPEEDQGGYLSSAVADTRESDQEEYIQPTTFQPSLVSQTTLPPPVPFSLQPEVDSQDKTEPAEVTGEEMPAKAALDLYAILQQTQEENSVVDNDFGTTDLPTTEPPTTTQEPSTTPTTTTTTTTTTPPPPPEPTKRGRFRGGGTRNRVRTQGASTTTTTEAAPEEEASQRPKFKPSHSRSPGQVSAYGRRRASAAAAATSTTEVPQQSTRARSNFQSGSNGNRYRTRGRASTTSTPVEEEEPSEEAEPSSTTAKPRVRIGATAGARPLRPGPRLNLRPLRPGSSSITPPPPPPTPEATVEQEVPTTPEPAAHSEGGDALTKLRSRPRLKVQPVVPQTRPFSNQRRPLIGLTNRRRTTESEVSAETTTQPVPVETETPLPSSTEPQPHTTENKLASLIGRRRPINRRLPIQPAGDH